MILTPEALGRLHEAQHALGSLRGRVARRADEDVRGLPWTIPSPRPTPESVAMELLGLADLLVNVADEIRSKERGDVVLSDETADPCASPLRR